MIRGTEIGRSLGAVGVLAIAAFAIGFAITFCGCAHTTPTKAAAEAAYTDQLLDCVDKSSALAESKACRAGVDAKWGIGKDGGQ